MARSKLTEDQVRDEDFLSEEEALTLSGSLQVQIDAKPDTLLELYDTPDNYSNGLYIKSTASGTEWATASGGSGTSFHSELDELDYESSGHTGFASSVALATTSGTLQDQLDSLDYYTTGEVDTISGALQDTIDNLDYYTTGEVDTISGSLQDKIDNLDYYTTGEVDTISGSLYNEIYTVSGSLQNEIDTLTYLDLTDTPTTYSGEAGKFATVKDEEDGLIFDYFEWDPEGPLIPETAISGTYYVNFEGGRLLIGATGNKPDLVYNGPIAGLAFDASKVESCYGVFKIPYAWNTESDIKVTINYMNDDAQTGTKICSWRLDYHTYAYGEAYSSKTTTTVDVDTTLPTAVAAGTYLTEELSMEYDDINNPIMRGDMVTFKFYREGSAGADNMTGDSILLALMFELQVGQNIAGG